MLKSSDVTPRVQAARALGLLCIGAALIALLWWDPRRSSPDTDPESEPQPNSPTEAQGDRGPAGTPAPAPEHTADCASRAWAACHEGDVWWFDACGEPEERAEVCEGRGCAADRCNAAAQHDPRCVQVSAYGVCEGDRAVACIGGQMLRVDCAARGLRCVTTREGAQCLPRDPRNGCDDGARPYCRGERLRECVDGSWEEIDCAARRASCVTDGDGARCGPSAPALALPAAEGRREVCNGRDDDADDKIDEADACRAVPLVAFVPRGAQLTELAQRMAADLEIANRAFAPIQFAWAKQVEVPGELRAVDPDRLDTLARLLSQSESSYVRARTQPNAAQDDPAQAGLPFYVAVLFAERIRAEPPKAAISTLPNATCGGVRISDTPSPAYGVVVLSDQRTPQSLSHELGHYLGLCHTHETLDRIAAVPASVPSCKRSGDGICDTAQDPGPEACNEVAPCDFYCAASSARPNAANLMSYYMHCRQGFTPEQLAEVSHGLELRRGWFRCLDPQDCPCDPAARACPMDMSCHPRSAAANAWNCELDGPGWPGTACQASSQCGFGAICMSGANAAGRCIRPCAASADCKCEDVGLPFPVCAQDLDAR